jgi:hypothetical protein
MAQHGKLTRRLAGVLKSRLPELGLDEVEDPRHRRGRRWELPVSLTAILAGMLASCRSLAETENLTAEMSLSMRKLLRIPRRLPDTTARNVVEEVSPLEIRRVMHRQTRAAFRRKALQPEGLPFGMVAIDGKSVTIDAWDNQYGQRHRHTEGAEAVGLVRTMTCALVSARPKPCIDAVPIPAHTNEVGHFQAVLESLEHAYGALGMFRLVSGDAGTCSEENADAVIGRGWNYLFAIKDSQPQIRAELERLLGNLPKEKAQAETVDVVNNQKLVTRRLYLREKQPLYRWSHARTFVRVESETVHQGKVVAHENRYFICSLSRAELKDEQWLLVVRRHWGVENNCHGTWDIAFAEDARPWIRAHPRAAVVLMLLRRVAYNMVALFRSVTQRSEERRQTPWKDLLRAFYNTMISLTEADLEGLRRRVAVTR